VHDAVKRGDLDAVRQMVKANASLKEELYRDWTPLQWAAYHGHVHIVRYLMGEEGVDKDKVDQYRRTPLYLAAVRGQLEVVRYLAGEAGVDKDKDNVNGWTPLMIAAWNGHLEVVRYLLEEGADVTLKRNQGKTAITLAGNAEIAALLREYLPGGIMYQRRDAVKTSVLNQKDLGPDVAWFCAEFIKK